MPYTSESENSNDYIGHKYPNILPPEYIPTPECGLELDSMNTMINQTNCLMYVWLSTNEAFWFFPVTSDGTHLIGCGWNGKYWENMSLNVAKIASFF